MKAFFKGIAFVFSTAVLFSLCLTPVVFATEEPAHRGNVSQNSLTETELPEESSLSESFEETPSDEEVENPTDPGSSEPDTLPPAPTESDEQSEPSEAASSDAEEEISEPELPGEDMTERSVTMPSVAAKNVLSETDTVSSGEELLQWLSDHGETGGIVKLSNDIYLRDFIYVHGFRRPEVIIDTGEFSIIVADGYAELHAGSPLIIRGSGGENGVVRAARGGMLQINGLTLEAEWGYAVFQEEGAGFLMEQTSVSGVVHYADLPYVSEWQDVLVVEQREQSFNAEHLPAVLEARVIRQGQITDFYEDVPVIWDLTGHEKEQKQRQRFTISGGFENMASQKAPLCTVAYDDFPLTFLEVTAKRITGGRGDTYKFSGTFSKPENRLPITIAQEYSFDGDNWILYEEREIDHLDETFTIYLPAGKGKQSPPGIFIRLSWNDDGIMYYSNVLRFTGDSLEKGEEHGGNRGGGTDIIDTPELPEPDTGTSEPEINPPPGVSEPKPDPSPGVSEPEADSPPGASEPETDLPPGSSEPETDLPPGVSEPETDLPPEAPEPETDPPPGVSEPETDLPPEAPEPEPDPPPGASEPDTIQTPEEHKNTPAAAEGTSGDTLWVLSPENQEDSADAPFSPEDSREISAEPEPVHRRPDALSAIAGTAAVAASIGGAALYLHPKARKKLLGKLWNFFKR